MLAPCGIICTDCSIYKAAMNREEAEALAKRWRDAGNKEANSQWFNCRGCFGPDEFVWSEDCGIRKCCLKVKHLDNCSLCGGFPCELIIKFENDPYPHHKTAVANLRKMRGK
jgi:hypothetical protein